MYGATDSFSFLQCRYLFDGSLSVKVVVRVFPVLLQADRWRSWSPALWMLKVAGICNVQQIPFSVLQPSFMLTHCRRLECLEFLSPLQPFCVDYRISNTDKRKVTTYAPVLNQELTAHRWLVNWESPPYYSVNSDRIWVMWLYLQLRTSCWERVNNRNGSAKVQMRQDKPLYGKIRYSGKFWQ